MPYSQGTFPTDANSSKTFMETTLHTALLAKFSYVEEYVSGATARVYKSLAASNFYGQDWYLIVKRASDTAVALDFSVCELYDPGTHICRNYAPSTQNLLPDPTTYAVNDPTGKVPTSSSLEFESVTISNTGFNYHLSITSNRICIGMKAGSTNTSIYAGLYSDIYLGIRGFPLAVAPITGSASNGAATRETRTSAFTYNFDVQGLTIPQITLQTDAHGYTGKYWLSKVMFLGLNQDNYARGLGYDLWRMSSYGSPAIGDTTVATIDGVSKNIVSISTNYIFVDQAL